MTEQVLQNAGSSEQLDTCPTSRFNRRVLAASCTCLPFRKEEELSYFLELEIWYSLSSFIEQMLKQNNISSQGFSIMYLSEDLVPLEIKNCQEVAR